jgi:toxin-antitoxin system PIN domain toxin
VTTLLDGSVLIALASPRHEHHGPARLWFLALDDSFASCPITQGSLLRHLLREGLDVGGAQDFISSITRLAHHEFWPDNLGYEEVRMDGVLGHGQVTDAYLAQLARANGGRLATFDQGLAGLHPDVVDLVPVG